MTAIGKKELVRTLEETGKLLELKGENPFKCRAFYNAARNLEMQEEEPQALVASGRLAEIKGVGKALQEKIVELVETGRLEYYEQLRSEFPDTLFDLFRVPGLGVKKVKAIYEKLGVASLGELEYACTENRLALLEGFGEKSQAKVLQGIAMVKRFRGRFLYSQARAEGQRVLEPLCGAPGVVQADLCGSLRRCKETVADVDLVASAGDPAAVLDALAALPGVEKVLERTDTKCRILLDSGIEVDLQVVPEEAFPAALAVLTGSKGHVAALKAWAKKKDYELTEAGLSRSDGEAVPCDSEAALFEQLALEWIPPELREATGEIEAAAEGALPKLIEPSDIQGIFHVHTTYSDGADTIEVMAREAQKRGYHYLGIADHSQSAFYANGLSEPRVRQQHEEIDRVNAKLKGITILKGIEADILPDGSLDYSDAVLASFDFVVASVHSSFGLSEEAMTARLCRALENPYTTMLGHPTGRLLLSRESYALDMEKILQAAQKHGKIIELNAHPYRLDLDWIFCKEARKRGIPISINPDAHETAGFDDVQYGVAAARRGWLEKGNVFNTQSVEQIKKRLGSS